MADTIHEHAALLRNSCEELPANHGSDDLSVCVDIIRNLCDPDDMGSFARYAVHMRGVLEDIEDMETEDTRLVSGWLDNLREKASQLEHTAKDEAAELQLLLNNW